MSLAALRRRISCAVGRCSSGARGFLSLPGMGMLSLRKRYKDSLVFPFSREQVFDVVADIDNYRAFVPMCTDSRVLVGSERTKKADSINPATLRAEIIERRCIQAELAVGYPPFSERYTSVVELDRPWRVVATADPAGGLFKHMRTVWEFVEQGRESSAAATAAVGPADNVLVSFSVEFEFASPVHAQAASLVFDSVAKRNLTAYLGRCRQLYAK
ncbi:Coenzyme Q-binding protein coq10a, mitochondrial [Coemansia sp. RSA 2320]|nr:Coenzyme Q-binding protein coq10a, mitochondrial [Coemansia sp. RSA 2320]